MLRDVDPRGARHGLGDYLEDSPGKLDSGESAPRPRATRSVKHPADVHTDTSATGPRVAHRRSPGAVSGDEARADRSSRVAGSSTHQGGPVTRTP